MESENLIHSEDQNKLVITAMSLLADIISTSCYILQEDLMFMFSFLYIKFCIYARYKLMHNRGVCEYLFSFTRLFYFVAPSNQSFYVCFICIILSLQINFLISFHQNLCLEGKTLFVVYITTLLFGVLMLNL